MLYQSDLRREPLDRILAEQRGRVAQSADPVPSFAYAAQIVEGVDAHRASIDEIIESYAEGWTIARMPRIDVAVLRVGAWEVLYNDDVPRAVAISEAADLAAAYSTERSPKFVSGVLNAIAEGA